MLRQEKIFSRYPDFSKIEKEALKNSSKRRVFKQLGGWGLNLYATRKDYIGALRFLLMQKTLGSPNRKVCRNHIYIYMIDIAECPGTSDDSSSAADSDINIQVSKDKKRFTLKTRCFSVFVSMGKSSVKVVAFIKGSQQARKMFKVHLPVVVHEILFAFDRMIIHSGTIRFHNRTCMFVGERAAGKTTTCLWLAKEGAKIIAEDHTLIRRDKDTFFACGYEDLSRVSNKVEKYIFEHPIEYSLRKIGGFFKKEFPLKKFFDCALYREFPVDFIFFIHVGKSFQLKEMTQQKAVVKLIEMTKQFFRFHRPQKYDEYIGYFCQLAKKVKVFDLELSADVTELDKLVNFLKKC